MDLNEVGLQSFDLQSLLEMELIYLDQAGSAVGKLAEIHRDPEGNWLSVKLLGTTIGALRSWRVSHPGETDLLYVGILETPPEKRLTFGNVAYLKRVRKIDELTMPWGRNCVEEVARGPPGEEVEKVAETEPLRRAAAQFGFPGHPPKPPGDQVIPNPETPPDVKDSGDRRVADKRKKKKASGKARVKDMLLKSKWSPLGTPLDPHYKRPIKIKLNSKKSSSSSSGESVSSESSSLDQGHKIRRVARRLPGYLTRLSGREAVKIITQAGVGEEQESLNVFKKYYRQVLSRASSSKPMLREGLTLATALDLLVEGQVLMACDIMSQRLKSLEMMMNGASHEIAQQVEIIPKEMQGLASQAEGRLAKREYNEETRLQKTLKGGKGKTDPPGKGDRWEQKGKKRERQGRQGERRREQVDKASIPIPSVDPRSSSSRHDPPVRCEKSSEFVAFLEPPGKDLSQVPGRLDVSYGHPAGGTFLEHSRECLEAMVDDAAEGWCSKAELKARSDGQGTLKGLGITMLSFIKGLPPPKKDEWRDHDTDGIFPLPLPRGGLTLECEADKAWLEGTIRSINWLARGSFALGEGVPSRLQERLLDQVVSSLVLLPSWKNVEIGKFDFNKFWTQKHVNSYGEEVHVARSVRWENISESLPKAGVAGVVPASLVCEGGMKSFIDNPVQWLKPAEHRVWMKPPKVMVPLDSWDTVVSGLLARGVCGVIRRSEIFCVDERPIMGGIFGVEKGEKTPEGIDILRLIMDLRPINANFLNLNGDLTTLPVLSQMYQLELRPHEDLVISSEDIRAMFYIIGLPDQWKPYLAFSRAVPPSFRLPGCQEECYLYSRVLPMGFVNSVAIAQHLHRRMVARAVKGVASSSQEIRRDKEFPRAPLMYRTYLDNFDELSVRSQSILQSGEPSLVSLLQKEYEGLGVPRNEKKAVFKSSSAELQGAWIDGELGIAYAKPDKTVKYMLGTLEVLRQGRASRKQLQMLAGGLVYLFSFRRPLMACLNDVWQHISRFDNDTISLPLPRKVSEELIASCVLACQSFIDMRLQVDGTVTASDASEPGGGLCRSDGLTVWGTGVAQGKVRGEIKQDEPTAGLLVISCFDGIGALRVALDVLRAPVEGYISIEKDSRARRVVESAFPSCDHYEDVTEISKKDVDNWAAKYPNCKAVLIAGGPPCQGVSGLNASRLGAIDDPRSSLFQEFCKLKEWVTKRFTWCRTYSLMESVFSMTPNDRGVYSKAFGVLPYLVDSSTVALCRRPRLWWFDWIIKSKPNTEVFNPQGTEPEDYGQIIFHASVNIKDFLYPGWKPTVEGRKFCTFTTAQPKLKPGFKPAGIDSCSFLDLLKWKEDRYRFPPYVYRFDNGVEHRKKGWRLLRIQEKEAQMGFPVDFTIHACKKQERKTQPIMCDDVRMSLIGNSWHIGVVSLLLQDLLVSLDLIRPLPVQSVIDRLAPGTSNEMTALVLRMPLVRPQPYEQQVKCCERNTLMVQRLAHLVSNRGSDILLVSPSDSVPRADRFRHSIPRKLWVWKTICGWKWKSSPKGPEHINKLELRAAYTALKWRVVKQKLLKSKVLHLLDSMVSLQVLNKGRSSSFKLRPITRKFTALLVASRLALILGYIATDQNPADAPSRRGLKRKW